jgi:AbrB family looped-hinge helix DNA binding protein
MPNVRVKVAVGGGIVIPAEYRRALGLRVGDEVILRLQAGEVLISSTRAPARAAIGRRSRELVRRPPTIA